MTRQDFKTAEHVRLEVEVAPTGLVNLVPNPDGALGGWGWITPNNNSRLIGSPAQGLVYYAPIPAANSWVTTEPMPMTPGHYAAAVWVAGAVPPGQAVSFYKAGLQWLDASGALIGEVFPGPFIGTDGISEGRIAPQLAPAGTAFVCLRFSQTALDQVSNPPPEAPIYFTNARVAAAATSAALATPLVFPSRWVNIMGPTHTIDVDRAGLDVGTLTAEVLDATLDPSQSAQLRPGGRVRLTVKMPDGSWSPLFTGKADALDVAYDEKARPPKPPRISLIAVDPTTPLAAARRSQGVGAIDDLPAVLEGAGVPWNTNGSGNQVTTAAAVSTNENATALDQVALTRDTRLGSAWVDRHGVLRVEDRADAPVVPGGTFDAVGSVDGNGYVFGRAPINATAARVTTPVRAGAGALRLTATSAAATWWYMGAHTLSGAAGMPVVGGRTYTVRAYFRAATVARRCSLSVNVFKGNTLVQSTGSPTGTAAPLDTTTGWTEVTHTFTAAPGAKFVSLTLTVESTTTGGIPAGEVHYIDEVAIDLHRRNPLTLDEATYADLDLTFATADLINSVSVRLLRIGEDGTTVEAPFGPYEDAASIREWGRRGEEFTVHGLDESELAGYAQAILARNATPQVRANTARVPIRTPAAIATLATLDLYDEPTVANAAKGINRPHAVASLRHLITPDKWMMEAGFTAVESVASPRSAPTLAAGATLAPDARAWMARSTALVTLANATPVDVPGCSLTVPLIAGQAYYVVAVFDVEDQGANGIFAGELVVNGVAQAGVALLNTLGAGGERLTSSQQWLLTPTADATSVIKLRVVCAGHTAGALNVQSTHTNLAILRV